MFYLQEVSNGIKSSHIKGIGFDSTCSLVVLDEEFNPVAINPEGKFLFCFLSSVHHFL